MGFWVGSAVMPFWIILIRDQVHSAPVPRGRCGRQLSRLRRVGLCPDEKFCRYSRRRVGSVAVGFCAVCHVLD